jgi:ATP synthase protein I
MEEDKDNKKRSYRQFARYSAIGLEMGLSVAIGLAIGYYLDRYFQTKPWLTMIFLILGVVAGFRRLASLAKEIGKGDRKK